MNAIFFPVRRSCFRGFWPLLLAFCLVPFLVPADNAADSGFEAANRAYLYGSYEESAKLFRQLVESQGYSAALCFDLANAEAKAGHPGQAMLNYERARYLAPGASDIDHNLQAARKQAGLDPNSYRWWEIVIRTIDWTVWLFLIVVCLALIILALAGSAWAPVLASRLNFPESTLRKICKGIFFGAIPLALFLGYVELSVVGFANRIEGVIVAPKEAVLRISPFATAEKTGTIPEGELVTVEDRHNDYLRIEARDHRFGWVWLKDIEPVVPGSFDEKPSP